MTKVRSVCRTRNSPVWEFSHIAKDTSSQFGMPRPTGTVVRAIWYEQCIKGSETMRRGPVHESGPATGDGGPGASVPVHSAACALLGISRSSLYHRPEAASEVYLSLIGEIDGRYLETPFCGSKRMKAWLERRGMQVSRKRLMRAIGAADHLPAATVLPEAITTSASLSLLIISSGVCFLFAISSPFFAQDPKNLPGPFFGGQVKGNRSITGVQQPLLTPTSSPFDGLDLPGLAQEVPAVVERARQGGKTNPGIPPT